MANRSKARQSLDTSLLLWGANSTDYLVFNESGGEILRGDFTNRNIRTKVATNIWNKNRQADNAELLLWGDTDDKYIAWNVNVDGIYYGDWTNRDIRNRDKYIYEKRYDYLLDRLGNNVLDDTGDKIVIYNDEGFEKADLTYRHNNRQIGEGSNMLRGQLDSDYILYNELEGELLFGDRTPWSKRTPQE